MTPSLFAEAKQAGPYADPFLTCWALWPRKEGKAYAQECYVKACRKAYPQVIEQAVRSYLQRNTVTDPKFIPHFSTWLNKRRWLDEEAYTPEIKAEAVSDRRKARLESNAKMMNKGLRLTTLGPHEARECLAEGLITMEVAKRYGA
jgi:hypothetical protein